MNEITTIQNNALALDTKAAKEKALEYLSSMGLKLPEKHKAQFIELASAFGLNPFKREIYAVGYGDNYNIITGYEVYLKRAERIGKLNGWSATVEGSGENLSATVTIYRKDWSMPFSHTVYYREVVQKTKDGKPNSVWAKMPSFMLRKVAIAQGFRLCFPDEMGGMPYTSDELPEIEKPAAKNETTEELAEKALKPAKKVEAAKKYTAEQANEIKTLLDSTFDDGSKIFNEKDADNFRKALVKNGDEAVSLVKATLQSRIIEHSTQGETVKAPTFSMLNKAEETDTTGDIF